MDEIEGKMRLDDSGSSQRSKKKKSFDGKKQQIGSEVSFHGLFSRLNPITHSRSMQFKAKKGGGDVKKGDISPYAYVPLGQVAGKGKNKSNIHIKGQKGRGI